ncbi:hypothetical protein I551_1893 [Mycobacterium ulcerans str. Harvey]|uniref:Alpha-(1->3)-arabinofuranosyltransferase N-terminal GT-C domain-containing protein n=1 Tax=Mycobacterium ulcerans str. Harvey TaxID=1299332 RepID=A0ABN0R3C5_MYCUL|nr:hypothetical protein I551_1893 [Mycobacterium ulcerans str. Harvey]
MIDQVGGAGNPGAPYFADTASLPRVDGGPEVLLRLDERRRLLGQTALGPVLLTQDARAAQLPVPVVTVTDTPVARETDYGRVDQHSSAVRAPGDARHTYNRIPDYPVPGAEVVYGGGPAAASPFRVRRRTPPPCPTSPRGPRRRPRSTATRRPRGCPTRFKPRSGSGCRWTSTIR